MKLNFFLIFILCLSSLVYSQEGARKYVGKIIKIEGKAYLKEEGKKLRELTARDKDTLLFAEQELGCLSKCLVRFSIGSSEKTINKGHYIIPHLIKRRTPSNNSISAGSKTRGVNDILVSPVENGIGLVSPEFFKFRWRILKIGDNLVNISPLTISLNDCKTDEHIWSQPNIDYKQGSYVTEGIKGLLKKRQQKHTRVSLEVVIASESFDKKQRYCFDIISTLEEQRLRSELTEWDNYADLIRYTERAYIFNKHKLFSEAAEEFNMALKMSPKTDYLLADTIKAHYKLGDLEMVDELINNLEKLSPNSELYNEILILTKRKKKN